MFGYGKDKKYVSFPFDWLKPAEAKWDFEPSMYGSGNTGFILKNDRWYYYNKIAWLRKYILKEEPIFWMNPRYKKPNIIRAWLYKQCIKFI